jgi:hypothetical protein
LKLRRGQKRGTQAGKKPIPTRFRKTPHAPAYALDCIQRHSLDMFFLLYRFCLVYSIYHRNKIKAMRLKIYISWHVYLWLRPWRCTLTLFGTRPRQGCGTADIKSPLREHLFIVFLRSTLSVGDNLFRKRGAHDFIIMGFRRALAPK